MKTLILILTSILALSSNSFSQEVNKVHIVETGNTLYSISKIYGVSVEDLKMWNHLSSDEIVLGQELKIYEADKKPSSNANTSSLSPSARKVHTFPQEFVGKTIVFNNTRFYPILKEFKGYYTVQIDMADSPLDAEDWGFTTMHKVMAVVEEDIAKQMINKGIGGYKTFYYGSIKGTVIKTNKIPGTEYLFVITKLVNYPPNEPTIVIAVYEKP